MEAQPEELLRRNTGLHAKRSRMLQQLLYYHGEVMKLTWTDDNTRLFDKVLLRYQEAPPPVDVRDGALPQGRVVELLGRNNCELWAMNQSMSRDLRFLETTFEDLMIQKTCDAETMTVEDEADKQQKNLQMLEADVMALKLEIDNLKEEKMKTEGKQQCVGEETRIVQMMMQALREDTDRMGDEITDQLKMDSKNPTLMQALREQAEKLQRQKAQLEKSLQKLEASTRPQFCRSVTLRKFFTSR